MKSQQALIITKNSKIQETCDKLHSELENALKARLKEEREKPPVPLEESNSKGMMSSTVMKMTGLNGIGILLIS